MTKKKIMVFGTFDIFHPGHKNFLKQAKSFGDYLTVVIARDETVSMVKKQKPLNAEKKRLLVVKNSKLADKVILGGLKSKYAIIEKYKPDVICLGYDQKFFINNLKNGLAEAGLVKTKIKRLKSYHPEIYKSSKLTIQI